MMRASGAWAVTILLGAVAACVDAAPEPDGLARWLDAAALDASGFGRVRFVAEPGHALDAHVYRATGFDPVTGPVWFVMHGASRDVDRYIAIAAPVAERHDALAIAIHFPKSRYPRGADYTLGADARMRPHVEVERVFDATVAHLGGRQHGYRIFGHSAGAQFTHRLATFVREARIESAVAANAGWYTLPVSEDPRVHTMPYGLLGGPVEPQAIRSLLETNLVVLVGEDDTTSAADDRMVRGTREAMAQGANRLARGRNYFEAGRASAGELGADFAWTFAIVPGADHDAAKMIDSAASFLFDREFSPSVPNLASEAGGLVLTEILADPPDGIAGDANGDGVRDPQHDEFVEIFNSGDVPLCLDGWILGDAHDSARHVFPLARPLVPGETLVVFGGGVPTGDFHGARVQWADGSLGLSNSGDVLTLRDATGAVAWEFSWGDCDGRPCAEQHFDGELGINASIERSPRPGSPWRVSASYTPGQVGEEAP
jgi:hypothetical protein